MFTQTTIPGNVLQLNPDEASATRAFPGTKFRFIISAKQTNNAFAVAEYEGIPGSEPPRHVHTREDEMFLLREGSVNFFIGDEVLIAKPGDLVYMPKNIPHHFRINTIMKGLLIVTPGDFEHFFNGISLPFDGDELPALTAPLPEQVLYMITLAGEFGIRMLEAGQKNNN